MTDAMKAGKTDEVEMLTVQLKQLEQFKNMK
jgi:hypothetical protein